MLQYLTPDVLMALLKVQQGVMIDIAGKTLIDTTSRSYPH